MKAELKVLSAGLILVLSLGGCAGVFNGNGGDEENGTVEENGAWEDNGVYEEDGESDTIDVYGEEEGWGGNGDTDTTDTTGLNGESDTGDIWNGNDDTDMNDTTGMNGESDTGDIWGIEDTDTVGMPEENGMEDNEVYEENGEYAENGMNGGTDFMSMDTNQDSYLDNAEFCAGIREGGLFDTWDADNNGTISSEEFSEGAFEFWDTDGSGVLDENEWNEHSVEWFEKDYSFGDWDSDNDGFLTDSEFRNSPDLSDALGTWDKNDNGLDEGEFCEMTFSVADRNNDNRVDESEWQPFWQDWA